MHGLPEREYAVYLGLDVGKGEHHACALDADRTRLHDTPLPQDEARLRDLFTQLNEHGPVLAVVDQPASIGALPVAVARACDGDVAYLPGLAMRRIANLHPGNAKTDARDASVIAEAARTMPHTLQRVDTGDDALADLDVIIGFDDDLASEATRVTNRIHGLLTQTHPALERAIGPLLHSTAVLELLTRFGGPIGLRTAGRRRLLTVAQPRAPRSYEKIMDAILAALDEQTMTVPGTKAAQLVLPKLAEHLADLLNQRGDAAAQVEEILDAHPLSPSPDIHARHRCQDSSPHPARRRRRHRLPHRRTPSRLRRPSTRNPPLRLIHRGEHPNRGGNKNLKRAFFLSAFAALHDPISRAYYDRKRAQGKKHNATLICLARRRCDVLYAILRNGTHYQPPTTTAA